MPNLYTIVSKNQAPVQAFTPGEILSLLYHDIFDYPLSFRDLIKWRATDNQISDSGFQIIYKNGFYFLEGREGNIYKHVLRERLSKKKLGIARRAARILSFIPTVRMVAVTGSLAMGNTTDESDIDLMIVTGKGKLWTTRLTVYLLLLATRYSLRHPDDKNQKDKLCLNIWIDEADLIWPKKDRNLYTAHEIAQILPLVNKGQTYESFLKKNKWILNYWPNAVRIKLTKALIANRYILFTRFLEKIAYRLQYRHMKSKITREVITPTRALFHPQDWGQVVLDRIKSFS